MGSEIRKFGIKQVDKDQIATLGRLQAEVSSVRPSSGRNALIVVTLTAFVVQTLGILKSHFLSYTSFWSVYWPSSNLE